MFKTLRDAVILVAIVVLVFLQNWRSAIIPLVAVPVAIIGTFAVMASMGFSLNNLTLFGLVLAIGIVVDDAIVVVEAVEHHIEHGLSPRDATMQAMEQVSGPVIAVGLVLTAVFVPCAFITGITGQFFRQFALTIAVSTVISAFNSLTLSPALTALLLRPREKGRPRPLPLPGVRDGRRLALRLAIWRGCLCRSLAAADGRHRRFVAAAACWAALAGLIAELAVESRARLVLPHLQSWLRPHGQPLYAHRRPVAAGERDRAAALRRPAVPDLQGFSSTPKGFIPSQDKGYLLVNVQLPDSSSRRADPGGHASARRDRE